jgi:AraC-like DNA-binding protein
VVTVSEFALPVVARYADQVSIEATLDKEVVAPLLELMPAVDREFGRAHNRLHFPRAMFDEPLPQADSHTLQKCIAQCDVLMQRNEQRRGITAVVRSKLFRESGRFPTLPEMAAELDVHPRTLRRPRMNVQLAEEGTSFRALLNEARSTLAVDLLCNVGLTVDQVSRRLGYTDTSTFCHAFKRWHGIPPSAYPRDGRTQFAGTGRPRDSDVPM